MRKRKRGGRRSVLRVREKKTKRKDVAPERRSKCRTEVRRSEMRKDREKGRSFSLFPFFFSPAVAKG